MDKKVSKGLPAFIGVAAVWMGTHFGPGVASGTQIISYYVKLGIPGIICSVFAMCLLGLALYFSMETSRIYKTYNYEAWARNIWDYKETKNWIVYLFDLSFLITIMTALGGSLSAVGNLMNQFWGLNYWVGVILVIVITMFLCAYGADLVRKASSYMMFFIVGILLLIVLMLLINGRGDLSGSIAAIKAGENANITPNWGSAIGKAIVYAAFQATVVANIASVADTLKDRNESKKAAITGIIANAGLLVILGLVLLSYTSVIDIADQGKYALPFYALLEDLGYNWLTVIYILIVTVAVVSTAVGFSFAGVARFGKYYQAKNGSKNTVRDAAFVGIILLLCACASKFGIVKLVNQGYTILGYVNLPVILIPALYLGSTKIRKEYLKAFNIKASGID